MTRRRDIYWLQDIEKAIERIERHPKYSGGKAAYEEDEYFRDVVYLQVERVCEAATHLVKEFEYNKKYPELRWEEMLGMRIIVAHYYWKANDDVIWDTVEQHLPILKEKVKEWLSLLQ